MRAFGLVLLLAGAAVAQPPRTELPPLTLPPLEVQPAGGVLPEGTPVSRPLQPVTAADPPAPAPVPEPVPAVEPPPEPGRRPLRSSWGRNELLFWWAKAQPLPPLVTASRTGDRPVLGGPNTTVLVGGQAIDSQESAGARFTQGWSLNSDRSVGVEISYLFLGTRTYGRTAADTGPIPFQTVGRPVLTAAGQEDVILVAAPGVRTGQLRAEHSTRVTGWEVGSVFGVYRDEVVSLVGSAGYRYFMANEGLRVSQASLRFPTAAAPAEFVNAADQFDAHNRFHGGQLGLSADVGRDGFFAELTGKVALGKVVEVVRISGQSVVQTGPFPAATAPGGVLAGPGNAGRWVRSRFGVLPEGQFQLGYRFDGGSRFYVGYTLIYLSEAVRPGDQLDRAVSGSPFTAAAGPAGGPPFRSSDFWVQGLTIGLDCRY